MFHLKEPKKQFAKSVLESAGTCSLKYLPSNHPPLFSRRASDCQPLTSYFDVTLVFFLSSAPTAATGAAGVEAPAGAAGASEEDGEPPSGAGAGETAEGAEAAAAEEQGERTRE